jgi:uncharacterized Tic20 family protein
MEQQDENFYPLPQPAEITIREKEDAMGAYLMMFAALAVGLPLPIINLIAALIYYYVNKSNSRFVKFHAFQALISQIPTTIMNGIGLGWGLRIAFSDSWHMNNAFKGYVAMALIADIAYFVWGIIAAIKARKGHFYYFMLFGRIAYVKVFTVRQQNEATMTTNKPPAL